MKKYLVGIATYNEGQKIQRTIRKFSDYSIYDVLVIDDASTDNSLEKVSREFPLKMLVNLENRGAGYATRQTIEYAQTHGYETVFFISGNDKDAPEDIYKLKVAIDEGYDFVQGSRYLEGGISGGMPLYRKIATRLIHPWLFSLITGQRITDSTNGFRAIRTSIFNDKHIDLNQDWLDRYELEPKKIGIQCN